MKNIFVLFICLIYMGCVNIHTKKVIELYNQKQFHEAFEYIYQWESLIENDVLVQRIDDSLKKQALSEIKAGKEAPVSEIYLGFKFGMTKQQYDAHARKLIAQKKLEPETIITSSLVSGLFEKEYVTIGYKQDFYTEKGKCTAILTPKYFEDTLISLKVSLFRKYADEIAPYRSDIHELYNQKYGPIWPKDVYDTYHTKTDLPYECLEYLWLNKNLAILLYDVKGHIVINYVDLNAKERINNYQKHLEREQTELNKIKATKQIDQI